MKLRLGRKRATQNTPPTVATIAHTYVGTWSPEPTSNEVVISALRGLAETTSDEYASIKETLPPLYASPHQPIHTGDRKHLHWATWHHGSEYETFWFGDVMLLLHYAHITDTEREQLLLNARKAEASGRAAYATGRCITSSVPLKPSVNITHIGLVFTAPVI